MISPTRSTPHHSRIAHPVTILVLALGTLAAPAAFAEALPPAEPPITLEEEALLLKCFAKKLQDMGRELRLPHKARGGVGGGPVLQQSCACS